MSERLRLRMRNYSQGSLIMQIILTNLLSKVGEIFLVENDCLSCAEMQCVRADTLS